MRTNIVITKYFFQKTMPKADLKLLQHLRRGFTIAIRSRHSKEDPEILTHYVVSVENCNEYFFFKVFNILLFKSVREHFETRKKCSLLHCKSSFRTTWKCPECTERYGVFSPNAGKYGPEKLRIRTIFIQWLLMYSKNSNFRFLNFMTSWNAYARNKKYKKYWVTWVFYQKNLKNVARKLIPGPFSFFKNPL